jgi:hypothetical protein
MTRAGHPDGRAEQTDPLRLRAWSLGVSRPVSPTGAQAVEGRAALDSRASPDPLTDDEVSPLVRS